MSHFRMIRFRQIHLLRCLLRRCTGLAQVFPGGESFSTTARLPTLGARRLPISNYEGWVSVRDPSNQSNQTGISVGDLQAQNLAGTFAINGSADYAIVTFSTPEADGDYVVNITAQSYLSGPPAAGSQNILTVSTRSDGFTVTVGAAPGGTCEVTYGYIIVRLTANTIYDDYLPAIPSSFTNPLDLVSNNRTFGVGSTLIPATGSILGWDTSISTGQTVVEAGTTVETGNWWEISFEAHNAVLRLSIDSWAIEIGGAIVVNGYLFSMFNPGAHNVVLGNIQVPVGYFDGHGPLAISGVGVLAGTQQTPVHVGERYDASYSLTEMTLKHLKMDQIPARCISSDSFIGPGTQAQSTFFGDQNIIGVGSSLPIGGFASQIAQSRYGDTYYWLGARYFASGLIGTANSYADIFKPWLGQRTAPSLDSACIYPGTTDVLLGNSATDIYAALVKVMEGEKASGTFTPPNSFTSPADQRAWFLFAVQGSGTATLTVNGEPFAIPYQGTKPLTADYVVSTLNADSTFNVLFHAFVQTTFPGVDASHSVVVVQNNLPGSAGNAYIGACDGVGGSVMYGDLGGGFPGNGLSVGCLNGVDTTCVINGVQFPANFDTDANTTVNNLIALIAANGTINALVTCTLVGGKMFCEANAAGWAGNNIRVSGNAYNTPVIGNPWDVASALVGGSNGVVTSGIANIVLCTCPPIGDDSGSTGPMIVELNALNVMIAAYTGSGVTIADVWTYLHDPSNPDKLLPPYTSGNAALSDAGHEAAFNFLAPLLPGIGTAPSALSYATNPASYANGVPIAPNSPTVTGTVVRWTVSPPLPAGLSISSTTGDITGTPTTPTAAADYTVGARNTAGTITLAVNITIT